MTRDMRAIGKALGVSIEVRCGIGSRGDCQMIANGKALDQPRTPQVMRKMLGLIDDLVAVGITAARERKEANA